ncbi:MAG: AAA family ATPase, partial [Gemmatimonadota bacterium]|nr:AAA family ATPase [Gemmatimonadota bacterium]
MLTRLQVRNFKRFDDIEIELGNPVAFIGPNNSGKTSAMQAVALWDIGAKRWAERLATGSSRQRQRGIAINRRDLFALPVPRSRLLWRSMQVRDSQVVAGKQRTENVRIEIVVEGITDGKSWECGLEFDYANEESFYCRPLRVGHSSNSDRMQFPEVAAKEKIAFLPPMSGLAANETRLDQGAVNVRVGEGRTAEVLRNLCYRLYEEQRSDWEKLIDHVTQLFGVDLASPRYIVERGEIAMNYRENGVELDLSSSGRGLQQTMLLLAYMYVNPGAVLLLDEPDAHLEMLRQRQIYRLITEVARESGGQIIAASHSEVILNEAAGKDSVIAFVGKPHRIDNRESEVLKSLSEIGFEHYYQAELKRWVLYLEGPTDLAVLQAFAKRVCHEKAMRALERPYVVYVGNQAAKVRSHFHGLKEAIPRLRGIVLFDRFQQAMPDTGQVDYLMWQRRETENYFCSRSTLEAYVHASVNADILGGPIFEEQERRRRSELMAEAINEAEAAMNTLGRGSPWHPDAKVSDEFLRPLFQTYFGKLG